MSEATTPKRLWDRGEDPDALIHAFTVGDDPTLDQHLVHWDCLGSIAHAWTLHRCGLLTDAERDALTEGLRDIDALARRGAFEIPARLEDVHTAIEALLVARLGEVGEKIHAGRSRNDQVATAMRLFMRARTLRWMDGARRFARACVRRARADGDVAMPGHTHMQPAMPSSIGLWLHAFAEAALEQVRACLDLLERLDRCPLGTGAGFGVSLPLDRDYTAKLMAFSRVQRSPIDVQNSRGRLETYFVRVGSDIGGLLEKLSWDLILYSTPQYGFFRLPDEMTTGSSIMPQKHNPDVLELVRGYAGRLRGRLHELEWVSGKLPSNYHRDLQLTKGPPIAAAADVDAMLAVMERVVARFQVDRARLAAAMTPELFAADAALALTRRGTPFRQAYRRVAEEIARGRFVPPVGDGNTPPPGRLPPETLEETVAELDALERRARDIQVAMNEAHARLLPGTPDADASSRD